VVSFIVAVAANGVIGVDNDLPWHLAADLRRFRELTTGHTVIMGRRTHESIIARLGHGLPNRTSIVITRDTTYRAPDCIVTHTPQEALAKAGVGEVFVIGGAAIFSAMLGAATRIYLTEVKATTKGDAYFDVPRGNGWREVDRQRHQADDKNEFDFDFVEFERSEQ
jgi:dihydrofolate reductase